MSVDIVAQSANILAGTFLARAVYGGEYIDPAFDRPNDDDAEKADDYRGYLASQATGNWQLLDQSDLPNFNSLGGDARFTNGGLYNARVDSFTTNSFDAQGLLAVKDGNTLVLTFRGTDGKDPAVESGQTFTGQGVAANYKAFNPLINAAHRYLRDHPEITDVIVSGHSLGGAMVDVFALKDADRFRDLRPDGLTIVSLSSSGIPTDLPNYLGGIDADAAKVVTKTLVDIFGIKITYKKIKELYRPADYISIAATEDRAHFPRDFPDVPETLGLVPIVALKDNKQFHGDTLFDVPNIENADVKYHSKLEHPLDFRGMGAQHSSALLWANVQGLLNDDLRDSYSNHNLIAGITDYKNVPDFDGSPISLFEGYLELNNPKIIHDRGTRALNGTSEKDYILGLAGDDQIDGRGNHDLLSGGTGDDMIRGGGGNDRISGGLGSDRLWGEAGRDQFVYAAIEDAARVGAHEQIHDFSQVDGDRVNLRAIDAEASAAGNQNFSFIGSAGFTGEGQVRAIQSGDDTILRINTDGTSGAEMEIILRDVIASTLTDADFIL